MGPSPDKGVIITQSVCVVNLHLKGLLWLVFGIIIALDSMAGILLLDTRIISVETLWVFYHGQFRV